MFFFTRWIASSCEYHGQCWACALDTRSLSKYSHSLLLILGWNWDCLDSFHSLTNVRSIGSWCMKGTQEQFFTFFDAPWSKWPWITVKERNANSVYQFKYPILKEMFLRLILVSVTTLCKKQHFINFYFESYINSLIHKQTSYIFSYVLFVNGKLLSINF